MARIAWVMNGTMASAGLSGKAVLPVLLGFGCTVPAVLASRILENEKDRRRTILMTPFMSCSARLPVYVLFAGMFFPEASAAVIGGLYVLGVLAALGTAWAAWKAGREEPYEDILLMELPEYRWPDLGTVVSCAWERVRDYLEKAGTTIFLASLVLWFFLHLGPQGVAWDVSESFAAVLGRGLAPVLVPPAWEPGRQQWRCSPDFRQKRWWYPASLFFTEPGTEVLEQAMKLLQPVFQPAALPEPAPWHFWYSVSFTHPVRRHGGHKAGDRIPPLDCGTGGLSAFSGLDMRRARIPGSQPDPGAGMTERILVCMEAGGSEIDKERKTEWMRNFF